MSLVPVMAKSPPDAKRALIAELIASARPHRGDGPLAARSQDFLFNEDGLPE